MLLAQLQQKHTAWVQVCIRTLLQPTEQDKTLFPAGCRKLQTLEGFRHSWRNCLLFFCRMICSFQTPEFSLQVKKNIASSQARFHTYFPSPPPYTSRAPLDFFIFQELAALKYTQLKNLYIFNSLFNRRSEKTSRFFFFLGGRKVGKGISQTG